MTMIDTFADNPFIQLAALGVATLLMIWVSRRREARATPRRSVRASSVAVAPDLSESTLPAAQWLALVNNRPDEIAHLAIYGPSGSGKTTLCQGILAERGGQVIVIDPKPARAGQRKWGGMPYVKIDRDGSYRTIDQTLRTLRREVNTRLAALDAGHEPPLLTIVLDEYKSLVRECPESAPDLLLRVSDLGRELGMRLIILSQSRGVAALGVKGQGDTRENFVTVSINKQHRATLAWDEDDYQLDTAPVLAHAAQPIPSARWWPLAQDQSAAPSFGAISATHDRTGLASLAQSNAQTDWSVGETDSSEETAEGSATLLDAETIRALYSAGWSKNRICTKLRGAKDKKLRVIDAAIEDLLPSRSL